VLGISALDVRERLTLIALALLAGGLSGAALGGLASWRSASWALAPLTNLRDRVRQIDADAPSADRLVPSSAHVEIEDLRIAIASLVERLAVSLGHAQQFASQAAHELRTPLAVLAGELELLAETPGVDRPTIERLHGRVRELVSLVQRLLMLAGSGKLAAEHAEAIDLADIIDAVRTSLPNELAGRLRGSSDDDVIVRGDAELIRAMLANAVDNALKFSTDVVDVRASVHETEAWLEVIDLGQGVFADDRERVFAPFFRTAHARAEGTSGHGIGLALIRHVASVHGGRCEFVEVDRGARLRIRLPRWAAASK
jgi:signal transduction histidine kinase